jgi:hypothetical protein
VAGIRDTNAVDESFSVSEPTPLQEQQATAGRYGLAAQRRLRRSDEAEPSGSGVAGIPGFSTPGNVFSDSDSAPAPALRADTASRPDRSAQSQLLLCT